MSEPTCETCRWWEIGHGTIKSGVPLSAIGTCHRYPPTAVVWPADNLQEAVEGSIFPYTQSYDVCGEHEPRETRESQ